MRTYLQRFKRRAASCVPKINQKSDNNLISKVASLKLLDKAFKELLAKHEKRETSYNNLVWNYARSWETRRLSLREELQNGTFKLGPITNYQIMPKPGAEIMQVSVWEPESEIVLKVLKEVLEPYLKTKMDLTYASHLKGNGGLKACVMQAQKLCQTHKYILKTDVAKFYASIKHHKLFEILSNYVTDTKVVDLVMQFCNRCEITNANHVLIKKQSIPRGCPLSPLIGAIYLQKLDQFAKDNNLEYVRYMDDYVFFAKKRWQLRSIIKSNYQIIDDLGLWLAADKTYIGKLEKGFDFLGYRILKDSLSIAKTSFAHLCANISRLYEQRASNARLGTYLENWLRWAKGGVNNFISPIILNGKRNGNIKLNITQNPSARIKVFVSNDKCFVLGTLFSG